MKTQIQYLYIFFPVISITEEVANNKNPHPLKEDIIDIESKNIYAFSGSIPFSKKTYYYIVQNKIQKEDNLKASDKLNYSCNEEGLVLNIQFLQFLILNK